MMSSGERPWPHRSARRAISCRNCRSPFGVRIDVVVRAFESRCPGEEAIQAAAGQQFGARNGAAERHQPRVGGVLEQRWTVVEIEIRVGVAGRARSGRRAQRGGGSPRDIETRARPRLQDAAVLEKLIGLKSGREAGAVILAEAPQGGGARAGQERAALDGLGDDVSQQLVAVAQIRAPCGPFCSGRRREKCICYCADLPAMIMPTEASDEPSTDQPAAKVLASFGSSGSPRSSPR